MIAREGCEGIFIAAVSPAMVMENTFLRSNSWAFDSEKTFDSTFFSLSNDISHSFSCLPKLRWEVFTIDEDVNGVDDRKALAMTRNFIIVNIEQITILFGLEFLILYLRQVKTENNIQKRKLFVLTNVNVQSFGLAKNIWMTTDSTRDWSFVSEECQSFKMMALPSKEFQNFTIQSIHNRAKPNSYIHGRSSVQSFLKYISLKSKEALGVASNL